LIEAISYRVGDHSTSDFSKTYRHDEEMKKWNEPGGLLENVSDPIKRLENYLLSKGAITKDLRAHLSNEAKNSVRDALKEANKL